MRNPVRPNPVRPGRFLGGWNRAGMPIVLALAAALAGPSAGWADATPPAAAPAGNGSWFGTLPTPFSDLSQWVSGLFPHDERLVTDEIEQFKHTVDSDLSAFDTLVQQAGFTLASVSVGARLDPQISLSLTFRRRLSEPEKAALMTKITDPSGSTDTVQRSIIMILLNTAESAYAVRNDGFRLSQVGIELDTVPKVTLTMTPVSHWP